MLLYHATTRDKAEKIKEEGLLRGKPANWDGMYLNNMLYFAFNPEVANDYVETSNLYEDEEIVVFSVDTKNLNIEKMSYDWNNHCEYHNDINSLAYDADVPAQFLHELTREEIKGLECYEFDDLEYIDEDSYEIWDGLYNVFDEEVATNKEHDDEDIGF